MFKSDTYVTTIGLFRVKEVQDEFVELDSYELGHEDVAKELQEGSFQEVDDAGNAKNFDGFQVGDFFHFDGKYRVVRSNEVFTKIQLRDHLLSLPNHKLMEVE